MICKTVLFWTLITTIWWIHPCSSGKDEGEDSSHNNIVEEMTMSNPKKSGSNKKLSRKIRPIQKAFKKSFLNGGPKGDGRFHDTAEKLSEEYSNERSSFLDNFLNRDIEDIPVSAYTAAAMKAADTGYPWYINCENEKRKSLNEPNFTDDEAKKMIEEFKQFRMDYEKKFGREPDKPWNVLSDNFMRPTNNQPTLTESGDAVMQYKSLDGRKGKINLKPLKSIRNIMKKRNRGKESSSRGSSQGNYNEEPKPAFNWDDKVVLGKDLHPEKIARADTKDNPYPKTRSRRKSPGLILEEH